MQHLDRRKFLKLSSAALGGIILTGCGVGSGSVSGSATPTNFPNGYRYYRLKNLNDLIGPQSNSFQIKDFLGSAFFSSDGIISFDAEDGSERRGIFQMGVDFSGTRPQIDWEAPALLTGDQLEDQRVVSNWGNYDIDESGNIAAIINADLNASGYGHFGSGLYFKQGLSGFSPILIAGQTFNGGGTIGEIKSSGIMYCVSLKNNMMISALNHLPADGNSTHLDSLLYIPNATLSSASLLLSSGDPLTDDYKAKSFGLIDHNDIGQYSATVFATAPSLQASANGIPDQVSGSFNFSASVAAPSDSLMLTASPGAGINAAVPLGEAGYAPRIGPSGETYVLLQDTNGVTLVKDGQTLLSTGDTSSEGKILNIGVGSVGADGLYYYSARTDSADWTLFAYDGTAHIPLISSGNVLTDGGAPVARIWFGTTKRHIDSEGRLVFCCTFTDGSTSLVVGIPA